MIATDYEQGLVLLLIVERENLLIPISESALHVGQSSRKNLRTRYKNALVVSRQGMVRRIEEVVVVGLWGTTFSRKLLSLLTSAWAIQVHFSPPITLSLDELKTKIVSYLQEDQRCADPNFSLTSSLEQTVDRIRGAALFTEVFDSLNVPLAKDCLDVF